MDPRVQSLVDGLVANSNFTFPDVNIGDAVIYYRGGDVGRKGYYGICVGREGSADNCDSIAVLAYPPGGYSLDCYGVRHKDDPKNITQPERAAENGVFALAPQTIRIQNLERELADLRGLVTGSFGDRKPQRQTKPGRNPVKSEV